MYPNIPPKMRKNAFKLASCPKPSTLFAKCLGLTVPNYPSGQTAFVDVDPVIALNRASQADYESYISALSKEELQNLTKDLE